MVRTKRGNEMSNYKKKTTLVRLDTPMQSERHSRAMKSLKDANKVRRKYKKGESPSENRAKLEKQWRDSWFTTKD